MDILNQIVESMNKEEVRNLKLYFARLNIDDRKDIALFDYIRKSGEKYNEDKIVLSIYSSGEDKNSFYRLKNRLMDDITKSLTLQYFNNDESNNILYLLAISKYFFAKNKFPIALHFLKKAESKAAKIENFQFLDLIYSDFIKLSHELVSVNPEIYIEKRKDNDLKLRNLKQIDDILAGVTYRLKVNQNFSTTENPVLKFLQKTIDDFSSDREIKKSPALRFKIYHAVSQILLQRRDYKSLESYLLKTYKQFTKENLFNKSNHNTKLQMLTYLVNTLFATNKLELSLQYASILKNAMEEFNNLLFDKYAFFYYNALVLNYSVTDIDKGIDLLERLKNDKSLKNTPFYEVFVYLNLAILSFKKKDYHKSIKQLNKLYQHDSYRNTDKSLQFKISIAELIIRYELQDYDFFEHRVKQMRKDFKVIVEKEENKREKDFISIISEMFNNAHDKLNKELKLKIESFIKSDLIEENEDAEVINYSNWLKSKIKK